VHLGGFGTVLWWDKWTYLDSLTATFVNRNAAATLFGFGGLAALALVLERGGAKTWPMVAGAVCVAALLLTHSRAGVAASLIGVLVLIAARRPSGRSLRRAVIVGVAVGVLAVAAGSGVGARFISTDLAATDRAPVHAAVARAVLDQPWAGHGLGSFNRAFPMHRPPDLDQHWDKAHSSYLENAFELGLPAVAAFYAVLAAVAALTVRGLIVRRRHRVYPALGLAALALAGSHAVVDFTMQMPANALWFAALIGVGVAQSIPTRRATATNASGRSDSARR
ncbi:MAG: O-antigen ligase family protein, partial [Rhodospirillaceae bacterium]